MKQARLTLLALLMVSLPFGHAGFSAEPATRKSEMPITAAQIQHDVMVLAERNLIQSPDYWNEHLVEGGKCDGKEVASLLVQAAKIFKPVVTTKEAIELFVQRGILSSPDYWTKH